MCTAVRILTHQQNSFSTAQIIGVQGEGTIKKNQISEKISEQSDSTITKILLFVDNKLDFESLTNVYNRVHFIYTEIKLSPNWVNVNDSITPLFFYP